MYRRNVEVKSSNLKLEFLKDTTYIYNCNNNGIGTDN